ncbi:MAG: hypothetical protein WCK49_11325 [Myxococcaceae bacterium]
MRPLASFTKSKLEVENFLMRRQPLHQALNPSAAHYLNSDFNQAKNSQEQTSIERLGFVLNGK